MHQEPKATTMGLVVLGFIAVTGMATLIGSATSNTIPILIGGMMMLGVITVLLNEMLQVLKGIRDRMNGER